MPTPQKRAYAHSTTPMSPAAEKGVDNAMEGFVDIERKKKEKKIVEDYKNALITQNSELKKKRDKDKMIYDAMERIYRK